MCTYESYLPQLPSTTSGTSWGSETLGADASGQAESGATSQALIGSCRRLGASEGSLLLTMAVNLKTERSWRGGKGRGNHKRSCKDDGGGSGNLDRGKLGGVRRRDSEGGRGGGALVSRLED